MTAFWCLFISFKDEDEDGGAPGDDDDEDDEEDEDEDDEGSEGEEVGLSYLMKEGIQVIWGHLMCSSCRTSTVYGEWNMCCVKSLFHTICCWQDEEDDDDYVEEEEEEDVDGEWAFLVYATFAVNSGLLFSILKQSYVSMQLSILGKPRRLRKSQARFQTVDFRPISFTHLIHVQFPCETSMH